MAPRGNVRALYLSVLARPADDGGLDYYAGEWKRLVSSYIQDSSGKPGRSGQDYAAIRIREAMANSAEGQNRAGVIRNAYQTYLGRQPSNQELQNYVNQSRNTLSLVKEISESQESFTFKKSFLH